MAFDINAPRQRGPMENEKLSLYAVSEKLGQGRPKLGWSVAFGNPRITVFTNDPEARERKDGSDRITAKLDARTFFVFLELLKDCTLSFEEAKNPANFPPKRYTIPNYQAMVDGKFVENKEVINTLVLGRDTAGMVWISLIEKDKPKIKFDFTISDWHGICDSDNNPLTGAQISSLVARSHIKLMERIFPQELFSEGNMALINMTAEERKNFFSEGRKQQQQRGSYAQGKKSAPPAPPPPAEAAPVDDFSDDLPF